MIVILEVLLARSAGTHQLFCGLEPFEEEKMGGGFVSRREARDVYVATSCFFLTTLICFCLVFGLVVGRAGEAIYCVMCLFLFCFCGGTCVFFVVFMWW